MMSLADTLDQLKEFDFNDLDFERIGTWPIAGRIFIWILAFVVILAGAYFLKVKDLNQTLNAESVKETQLRQNFAKRAFEAANLEVYRNQMIEMEESFSALLSQLPKEAEVPGLLEDITERGNSTGLQIKSIELEAEVVKDFYVELPISIRVTGGYHQFGAFVSGVAALPRIVTLHDYKIEKGKDQPAAFDMEILAKTYRYKPQE